MIEIVNVYKTFEDRLVLDNISTIFHVGKANLVIGSSGSGKTVLVKSLIGLHKIDSGEIIYEGVPLSSMDYQQKKELRMSLGMVFQGGALFDSMNVEENVMFPLTMFTNMSKKEKLERVNFCLKRVNLINANNKYPSELSGGMVKRVAIARAISNSPKFLFCDEPNSGLDPHTASMIDNLIKEITVEFNITTVINTHDMNSVMEIGDHVVFIHKGKKWWEGSNEDFLLADNKELGDFISSNKIVQTYKEKILKEAL